MEFNLNVKKKRLLAQISLRVATKVLVNMICPNAGDRCFVNARQWNTWIETLGRVISVRSTQSLEMQQHPSGAGEVGDFKRCFTGRMFSY